MSFPTRYKNTGNDIDGGCVENTDTNKRTNKTDLGPFFIDRSF